MRVKALLLGLSVTALCLTACAPQSTPPEVMRVRYTIDSGPLPPEYQFHEEWVVTRDTATLTRSGKAANTQVNVGTWEIALDEADTAGVLETLAGMDCAALRRVESPDAPDGAGIFSYTLFFTGGETCELYFDPGASYPGSEEMVQVVDAFIAGLVIPPEALPRVR